MKIIPLSVKQADLWNTFMADNFPVVGAFLQTYEWGNFQTGLGRNVKHFFITNGGGPVAAFAIIEYPLPFGLKYGYVPRGPVIARNALKDKQISEVLKTIRLWAKKNLSEYIFLRLEPPLVSLPDGFMSNGFNFPDYYIQPRHNLVVNLTGSSEDILGSLHPSTRSNMARAERRGVTVEEIFEPNQEMEEEFFRMSHDTASRNGGHNIYPGRTYFGSFFNQIPMISTIRRRDKLALKIYLGKENGQPAAMHAVLFFGDTATYIYGAGYRKNLASKVTSYLHWYAMQDAKLLECAYYDLGGIDDQKWPSLTTFKRQFMGEEFSYIGNIDIPIKPVIYHLYNFLRRLKRWL